MSTTTHSTTLGHHVGADRSVDTVGQVLWQRIKSTLARIKAAIEDRRVRGQLAALPDSLLSEAFGMSLRVSDLVGRFTARSR